MRWTILPFLLLSPSALAQVGPIPCNANAQYSASTAGATQLVPANPTARIYVCSYQIVVGATATNVGLVTGTGTNCGTSTANVTPQWVLGVAGQFNDSHAWANGIATPMGNALCLNTSAANPVQALVRYYQAPGQ